jgi:hypothetical protein
VLTAFSCENTGEADGPCRKVGFAMEPPNLPGPDRPHIHVDEIALRIEADATGAQAQRRAVDHAGVQAGRPDVDRHTAHVEAVAGDAAPEFPQQFVGFGGAVAGDYVERVPRSDPRLKLVDSIQQLRVDRVNGIRAMIAQQLVDRPQGIPMVAPARPVFSRQPLAGVGVEQGYLPGWSDPVRRFNLAWGQESGRRCRHCGCTEAKE